MAASPPVTRLSLPSIPEFTAWMTIEEQEVPLYSVQEQPNKTICYVESKTGQHFAIHFQDTRPSRSIGLAGEVHIYGQWQRGSVLPLLRPGKRCLSARRDSPTTERPFIFDKVKTTANEDLACTSEAVHKNLGNVNLLLQRWNNRRTHCPVTVGKSIVTALDPAVHEDSKKANVSHAVSFGKVRSIPIARTVHSYDWLDTAASPFHDFEFRCRSREILESQGLITVSPTNRLPSEGSPVAGPSRSRSKSSTASSDSRSRSKETSNPLAQAPVTDSDDEAKEPLSEAEVAKLRNELAELKRQSRIAEIERRLSGHEGSQMGEGSVKVKREEADQSGEGAEMRKKVKLEKGGNGGSLGGMSKGQGKEKEVVVLSDSD
ncbi:hypothetical protein JCM5353_006105 [Sporobolomyces roseus]